MSENKLESEERNELGASASNLSAFNIVAVVVVIVVFLIDRMWTSLYLDRYSSQTPFF